MEITKIGWATKDKKSLRTTIPSLVRDDMGLKAGNYVIWERDKVTGKWYIKKVEGD